MFEVWKLNINRKTHAAFGCRKSNLELSAKHKEAFDVMIQMAVASSLKAFEISYDNFKFWCNSEEEEWDASLLLLYFNNEHLEKELWSNAFGREIK